MMGFIPAYNLDGSLIGFGELNKFGEFHLIYETEEVLEIIELSDMPVTEMSDGMLFTETEDYYGYDSY